jgi:hypothetical protein
LTDGELYLIAAGGRTEHELQMNVIPPMPSKDSDSAVGHSGGENRSESMLVFAICAPSFFLSGAPTASQGEIRKQMHKYAHPRRCRDGLASL